MIFRKGRSRGINHLIRGLYDKSTKHTVKEVREMAIRSRVNGYVLEDLGLAAVTSVKGWL